MVYAPHMTAPPTDRRVAPRRQPTLGTVCQLNRDSGENFGLGLVWNISNRGVSILVHKRIDPGTTLYAELMTASETYTLPLVLTVAHVSELRTGDFILGAQFSRPLSTEELGPFIG
jgi:hypothetical protein